jgi:hypothetical protein
LPAIGWRIAHRARLLLRCSRLFAFHHEGHEEHEESENESFQILLKPPNIEAFQKPLATVDLNCTSL